MLGASALNGRLVAAELEPGEGLEMRLIVLVAVVVVVSGCGGGGVEAPAPVSEPTYTGPWVWECFNHLSCSGGGVNSYTLMTVGGSYCVTTNAEARTKASDRCRSFDQTTRCQCVTPTCENTKSRCTR